MKKNIALLSSLLFTFAFSGAAQAEAAASCGCKEQLKPKLEACVATAKKKGKKARKGAVKSCIKEYKVAFKACKKQCKLGTGGETDTTCTDACSTAKNDGLQICESNFGATACGTDQACLDEYKPILDSCIADTNTVFNDCVALCK